MKGGRELSEDGLWTVVWGTVSRVTDVKNSIIRGYDNAYAPVL